MRYIEAENIRVSNLLLMSSGKRLMYTGAIVSQVEEGGPAVDKLVAVGLGWIPPDSNGIIAQLVWMSPNGFHHTVPEWTTDTAAALHLLGSTLDGDIERFMPEGGTLHTTLTSEYCCTEIAWQDWPVEVKSNIERRSDGDDRYCRSLVSAALYALAAYHNVGPEQSFLTKRNTVFPLPA